MNAIVQHQDSDPTTGTAAFQLAQRQASALAASDLVPPQYRGNVANTLLALEVANRIGASPFAVMQNLYMVQGRPSWSSSFLIATVNACGRFEPLRFEIKGDDPASKDYRVRAYARDKASGEVCLGSWITWAMVDAEGWAKKNGSKWHTMPEQMFMYRAAGFWSRVYAPEISLGILTAEEAQDIAPVQVATVQALPAAASLRDKVRARAEHVQGLDAIVIAADTTADAESATATDLDAA